MSYASTEIDSQPECWRRAAELEVAGALPALGERVAVIGCGTSLFMARAYAGLRESLGQGETDAFAASEAPLSRPYDAVVAITRSGTTTEVLAALGEARSRTVALTADPGTPVMSNADQVVVLDFADERSVVQTRFATTALQLLRTSLGIDIAGSVAAAEAVLAEPVSEAWLERRQFTFLGRGWTTGLADEAALKMREAAGAWTESYPAMEYRHGPISITGEESVTWMFGPAPEGLAGEVARAGGLFVDDDVEPVADLVRAQRLAVALAEDRGLDPDAPRNLTRSVILT